jgi:spore maturation protein B
MSDYFIAGFIAFVIIYGLLKRCNCLSSFASGVKEGAATVVNMYVYILGFVFLIAVIENCGIVEDLERLRFSGVFTPILFVQMLLRPFSGSSSFAMMIEVYEKYGPDSFTGLLTTFIHTVTDSTIYITVFYFSAVGIKKYGKVIGIGLVINLIGFILSFLIVYFFL